MARAERSRALEAEKRAAAAEAYLQVTRTGEWEGRFSWSLLGVFLFALEKVCVSKKNLVGVVLLVLFFLFFVLIMSIFGYNYLGSLPCFCCCVFHLCFIGHLIFGDSLDQGAA